ncbi:maleylpyruvate isomerase family mycothiol-dependent enzyme [Nocardiopsis alba]|uniref:maleylpyruvate isomerase family mycothiol-dependent enzyme n=1 Tax=Nocardiopsis alba TaxID=53437 RepID=UPI0035DA9E39
MDTPRYLTALREQGTALAEAAEGRLHARVPGCPEWTMADLVWHVGEVHHFWRTIASGALADPEGYEAPERPDDDHLTEWYRDGLAETLTVLTALDPAAPRWTWAPRKDGAFIQRRMAQETAVHAWDAWDAAGGRVPLPADLAADGVEEFLSYFLDLRRILGLPDDPVGAVETVLLITTDTGHAWTVDHTGSGWRFERGAGRASCEVRGSASDLLLALWRRTGPENLGITGETGAFATLIAAAETE